MINQTALPCTSTAFAELSVDILHLEKSVRFQAKGSSMQPLVRDCDILLIEPLGGKSPRLGEVVLCTTKPDKVVVHRVIRRRSDSDCSFFLVQGDQALKSDGWIPQDQVHGRLSVIERNGARILLNNPRMRLLGFFALLRSRWNFGRSAIVEQAGKCIKRLPIFTIFLR